MLWGTLALALGAAVGHVRSADALAAPVPPHPLPVVQPLRQAQAPQATASGACASGRIDFSLLTPALALAEDETLDGAWRCADHDGEHVVTVSRLRNPSQRGTQLVFTQRTRQGKGWKKDWQARDFFLNLTDGGGAPVYRVVLGDADADGHMEAYLAYVLPGPSQSVDEGKLLVFSGGRKFAIRGAIPRSPDDFGSRQIGTAFRDLPPAVQAQALGLWDALSQAGHLQPTRTARPAP